ncbi:MAG TPA: flagellar FlbD family protein [Actinophytocola sp.]|uniref:flagellar FlbD family protein n=1 Tax=Actinophytocola sp. TaxID=1872138 RepID=UPI002DBBC22C|nr:flagellar FlbD family protein [Actinophytocola sp.]HEU5474220.1 flagellar FlbD family protein [Actinophytocola sp.]
MILLNRLNGQPFALNPDLLERAESTPDTVITLLNGAKYVVAQSLDELAMLVRDHRALVLSRVQEHEQDGGNQATRPKSVPEGDATVLRLPERGQ